MITESVYNLVVLPQRHYKNLCVCYYQSALWKKCVLVLYGLRVWFKNWNLKHVTMQCTAETDRDSMDTAWDKLRIPLAHILFPFLGIFSIIQLYGGSFLVLWWRGQATRQRWSVSGFLLSDPILFLKILSVSDPNPVLDETILSVSKIYPKMYCDAQHKFFVLRLFCLMRQNEAK